MQVKSVVWFFRRLGDGWQETKPLDDLLASRLLDPQQVLQGSSLQSRFSIRLFSLLLFRARPEDSGIYICGSARGGDFFYAYDLDIQEARVLSVALRSDSSCFFITALLCCVCGKTVKISTPMNFQKDPDVEPWMDFQPGRLTCCT